jgi:hypothetical protein
LLKRLARPPLEDIGHIRPGSRSEKRPQQNPETAFLHKLLTALIVLAFAPSGGARGARGTTADGQRRVINRDALLRSLFPNGIPATEQALQQVNAWLEHAERLTRLR